MPLIRVKFANSNNNQTEPDSDDSLTDLPPDVDRSDSNLRLGCLRMENRIERTLAKYFIRDSKFATPGHG